MTPHFGNKVIGDEAYDEAVRAEKGGGHIFGVRVRGAIPETGPTNIAKRNTEHGVRVVNTVNEQESVSIEELKNILAENPTFFDALFEAELARSEGARPDALKVFESVEMGIKGQGRRDVLDDIAQLLGKRSLQAAAQGNLAAAKRQQIAEMNARVERNTEKGVIPVSTSEAEARRIADEEGLDLTGEKGTPVDEASFAGAKPEGSPRPGTQQPGEPPLVPKRTKRGK